MNKKIVVSLFVSLALFAVIAFFTTGGHMQTLNELAAGSIQSLEHPALTGIMKFITNMGEWFVYIPVALLLLVIPETRFKYGLPASVTLAVSASLNTILKLIFAIPRPNVHWLINETGYGFPSGHAMNGTAFISICLSLFLLHSQNKPMKILTSWMAVCFLLILGFSRIYLGVHNLTDILAGYAAGIFLCLLTIFGVEISQNGKHT